jgi:hypothetical protein
MHYWPMHKARNYFEVTSLQMASLERGDLPFFIERQRRTIFELSRSGYLQNLITFTRGQSEISERQILKMESFIKSYQAYFGYKQIILLNKQGLVVFATVPGLSGKNINDQAYKDSFIVDSFKLVTMTLTSDITPFAYDPLVGQKAIFITMPVFFDEALNGFLVIQLDNGEIERMLTHDVHLEKTEEYLIVQRIRDIITFVLPPAGDPELTLPVRSEISRDEGAPVERSALGYEGYGVVTDYRNIEVAGSWYFLPQLDWGFVHKDDYWAVVFYIRWFGYLLVFLVLCAILLTPICIYIHARKKPDVPADTTPVPPVDTTL